MKNLRFADVPAVAAIAATYAYFLLFDQFALLDLLQAAGDPAATQAAMAAMGITGLGASLLLARLLGGAGEPAPRARIFLLAGFAAAAAAALLAPAAAGPGLLAVAALAGVATALVTVPLAATLRELLASPAGRGPSFGLRVGLGTGLAYLFCNLPPVFAGSAATRSQVAAGVALCGLLAAWRLRPQPAAGGPAGAAFRPRDLRLFGLASLVLSFLALVWLDSAAFAVIQENAALKALTWSGGGATLLLGAVHLVAALVAGRLIDAGYFRGLLLGAFAFFAAALLLLESGAAGLTGPLYAAAVSIYSVALVAFPAGGAEAPGFASRRWRAGFAFGIAGWLGSALGVGMAQNLHRVPLAFLAAAGALLAAGAWLGGGRGRASLALLRRAAPSALPIVLFAAAGLAYFAGEPTLPEAGGLAPEDAAARGRRVYVAEGCIYCHSQYVRPETRDEMLWGPHHDLDRVKEQPPLIGLRRQGPDLSNVGRRRDAAALELQLASPRRVAAASAMPSYAHLFAPGDRRGPDLVAYLESLR